MYKYKIHIFYTLKKTNIEVERKSTVIGNLILLIRHAIFNELVIKNTLVKNKTILVLMEVFHLPKRQISLQEQPTEVF